MRDAIQEESTNGLDQWRVWHKRIFIPIAILIILTVVIFCLGLSVGVLASAMIEVGASLSLLLPLVATFLTVVIFCAFRFGYSVGYKCAEDDLQMGNE